MVGLGTLVNIGTILVGGALGLILKRVLSKRITDTMLQGIGLAVVIVGVSGTLIAAFTRASLLYWHILQDPSSVNSL